MISQVGEQSGRAKTELTARLLQHDTQTVDLGEVVQLGVAHCRVGDWSVGLKLLSKASRKERQGEKLSSTYYSYLGYGVARFDRRVKEGLNLCRHAVKVGFAEPENFLNLARTLLLARKRRQAVEALHRGLELAPQDRGLRRLRRKMRYRRRPVIPFLSRDAGLNQWLGRLRQERFDRLEE